MLAVRLHSDRQLRMHDEPVPEPGPGEALVRVTSVGLCGSDRHWVVDGGIGDAVLDRPLILGHEFGGIVETGTLRGRLVAVDPAISCDACEPCARGASNVCLEVRFAGHSHTDGALREQIAWPEALLHPLSDRVEPTDAGLVEPLAVGLYSLDLAGGVAGANVAVIGCGPIGLNIVALARGGDAASVVAWDPLPHRLDAARELGAVPAPTDGDMARMTESVDVCFDAAGDEPATVAAIDWAGPGGQVVLVGIPPDDRVAFSASVARRKGLTLRFVRRSTVGSFGRAVEMLGTGAIDPRWMVTLRTPLADAPRAFEALVERSGIKVIVEPGSRA